MIETDGYICRKFIVKGKVQGVWFRASTQRQAQQLDITGYAKNLANGNVEVVACGNATAVERLMQWCATGPELAEVEALHEEVTEQQEFPGFATL